MNWIDKLKGIIIVFLSVSISFIGIEYSYRIIADKSMFVIRSMLFESGDNFKNFKDFFKYYPNTSIRSVTTYSKAKPTKISDIVIEYDYVISTNNAGLVMQKDLKNVDKVIYIIGDSFTEGQGASPWFYEMEKFYENTNVKLVNLGILGTGPAQWNNLRNHITQEFNLIVEGLVINIIPEDMTRGTWVFNEAELKCLSTSVCSYFGGFQGFNFKVSKNNNEIKKSVLTASINKTSERNFKDFVKRSQVIFDIYRYIRNIFKNSSPKLSENSLLNIRTNEKALLNLQRAAKNKVFVNIVSLKSMNSKNFNNDIITKKLIDFLENNKFNFKWCDIPRDGFHEIDSHPNKKGYETLQKCTEEALKVL